jgi:hypothetical protein
LDTLRRHELLANINKCEFGRQILVYLGYDIGGGGLNIDPVKIEAIRKWKSHTSVIELKSLMGATQYL